MLRFSSKRKTIRFDKDYHRRKTQAGVDAGFRVINIWDWDNEDLMRAHGFVEIYDAGRTTYFFIKGD